MHSVKYLLLLWLLHPLISSSLFLPGLKSYLKVIHFRRELFVCRSPELYWIASGCLCYWNCACVSRLMQNTAFNIDACSYSIDVTRPVISSIYLQLGKPPFSFYRSAWIWLGMSQFHKHLKSDCRLVKISPWGVVQGYRAFLLSLGWFVSNPSKRQGNSGKQGRQQEQAVQSVWFKCNHLHHSSTVGRKCNLFLTP